MSQHITNLMTQFAWYNDISFCRACLIIYIECKNNLKNWQQWWLYRHNLSVLRQKGKSQNVSFTCAYQGVRKVRFSEDLVCFVFLKHPFWDSHFCLISDELHNNIFHQVVNLKTKAFINQLQFSWKVIGWKLEPCN